MTEKIDYSKLTDSEIDELMATEIMGWYIDRDRIDKIPYYVSMQSGNVMPVDEWHPSCDLNQVWECEDELYKMPNIIDLGIESKIEEKYARLLKIKILCWECHDVIHATARKRCEAMLMAVEEE